MAGGKTMFLPNLNRLTAESSPVWRVCCRQAVRLGLAENLREKPIGVLDYLSDSLQKTAIIFPSIKWTCLVLEQSKAIACRDSQVTRKLTERSSLERGSPSRSDAQRTDDVPFGGHNEIGFSRIVLRSLCSRILLRLGEPRSV